MNLDNYIQLITEWDERDRTLVDKLIAKTKITQFTDELFYVIEKSSDFKKYMKNIIRMNPTKENVKRAMSNVRTFNKIKSGFRYAILEDDDLLEWFIGKN